MTGQKKIDRLSHQRSAARALEVSGPVEALAHLLGLPKKDLIERFGWVYREVVTGEERTQP